MQSCMNKTHLKESARVSIVQKEMILYKNERERGDYGKANREIND